MKCGILLGTSNNAKPWTPIVSTTEEPRFKEVAGDRPLRSLNRGFLFPYILLLLGQRTPFVISRFSLNRGSLNRGTPVTLTLQDYFTVETLQLRKTRKARFNVNISRWDKFWFSQNIRNYFIQSKTSTSSREYSERPNKFVMLLSNFWDEHRGLSPVPEASFRH